MAVRIVRTAVAVFASVRILRSGLNPAGARRVGGTALPTTPENRSGMSFFDLDIDAAPDTIASDHSAQQTGRTGPKRSAGSAPRNPRRLIAAVAGIGAAGAVVLSLVVPFTAASADPSASVWHRLRNCESSDEYGIDTGNGYYGAYQFNLATWQSVGGAGYPNKASKGEQDARALILYRERGWQPWTCASILGLREDKDARSGRISDIHVPGGKLGASDGKPTKPKPVGTTGPKSSAPAWPGTKYWTLGDESSTIARWQAQMHTRGSFLVGTGTFGPNTLAVVKRIQAQNGLKQTGLLGPVTWSLAWTGQYRDSGPNRVAKPARKPVAHHVGPVRSAPAWPGTRYWAVGDNSATIAKFQSQMHRRGATLVSDGEFGSHTQAVVKRLQRLNHLSATGLIGPVTWKLAWTGRY
jgi:peptidoglycan hydrolase-like protein with peptidoglycan-binding domain